MTWRLILSRQAEKELRSAPAADRARLWEALQEMQSSPFAGDLARLKGAGDRRFRRRVGSWRIIFSLDPNSRTVVVGDILLRSSTTY